MALEGSLPKVWSNQGHLESIVHKIFAGEKIIANVRKESSIKNPQTGQLLELDVWLPHLNLSFEFQDPYHYVTTWESHVPVEEVTQKDSSKYEDVRKRGTTLLVVPCWWDQVEASLVASVRFARPDLLQSYEKVAVEPINLNPPLGFFELVGDIPDIGELMLASFPVSIKFKSSLSRSNPWWLGEKYDGMRFCWHPTRKKVYSRSGKLIPLRDSFYRYFPTIFLDGELWFGRSYFQETQKFTNAEFSTIDWASLRAVCFDVPETRLATPEKFEKRYKKLLKSFNSRNPLVISAPRVWCTSKRHIRNSLQSIIKEGGEGVIMRKPASFYVHGRSTDLMKLKASRGDKEALVVTDNHGEEGADVEVMLPDGITFTLPSDIPLKRGDIVTFTYENYSRFAIPIKPKVTRVRKDLAWEEVVAAHEQQLAQHQELSEFSVQTTNFLSHKPFGYWVAEKGKNMRAFFEKYARSRNLDPLVPESWYPNARQSIISGPGSRSIMHYYKGSVIKALVHLFEEVGFDQAKFQRVPKSHWNDVGNMRRFFISFAESNGFDPLVASNWYNIPYDALLMRKSVSSILNKFKGSLSAALMKLFPELGFDPKKFKGIPMGRWHEIKCKLFFDNFAKLRKFDPLVAKNWYSITHDIIVAQKGGAAVLALHRGSFSNALCRTYPNIGLEKKKFRNFPRGALYRLDTNRKFFIDFAVSCGFDPLNPENWYSIPRQRMLGHKGSEALLRHYKGSFMRALLSVFPDIGFDKSKFVFRHQKYWEDPENRRKMFLEFAAKEGFDPLMAENWYPITRTQVAMTGKGATSCFAYYSSISHALLSLFPNIGLEENKFESQRISYWRSSENKKKLLLDFAYARGFDPNIPENWYSVTPKDVETSGRLSVVLNQYGGSLSTMVIALFPDKKFDESKFLVQKIQRNEMEVRRNFFETFAMEQDFDPLSAENWYSKERIQTILNHKTIGSILDMYQMNLAAALSHLFPEIALDARKIRSKHALIKK
eukprot:Phypoly_transcript_01174.p1 GENE.Phypoly_transcript_01174~~Phypoly_transcript_01174.p1  ORF type:complete len:997 (+),score=112.19 Phypoly_transcript_01174:34-3024(+)